MNITWDFTNFNVYETYAGFANVVYSYRFIITATDGQRASSYHGIVRLNFDEITNYVPFEQLTKETVQQWTEASIDCQTIIKNLKESIIASGSATTTDLPAPWLPQQ